MMQIDNDRVKSILKQYKELIKRIHARILEIKEEMAETNEQLIEMASYPKIDLSREGGGSGQSDLVKTLLRYEALVREKETDLITEMQELLNEAESVNRLYLCYQAMKGSESFSILERLYIKKEPYKTVEMESGLSHKAFEVRRQTAIRTVKQLYESDLNNAEIIRTRSMHKRKQSGKKGEDGFEQLSLFKDI